MFSVRLATSADCAFVESCARVAYDKYIERIGKPPAPMLADFAAQIDAKKVMLAIDQSAPIAYAICYPLDDDFHLENIAVLPDYQSAGVGGLLVDAVQLQARQLGFDAVTLYTNELMHENLLWYVKLGYTEIGRSIENGFSRVYFRKLL